jgi:hypothetical protein
MVALDRLLPTLPLASDDTQQPSSTQAMTKTLPVIKVIKPPEAAVATTSEPPRQAGEHRSRNAKINKENSGGRGGTKSSIQSK